jgi:hypothetical protein
MLGYGTLAIESTGQIQVLNQVDYMPRLEAQLHGVLIDLHTHDGDGLAPLSW